jgi:hypothetical protein
MQKFFLFLFLFPLTSFCQISDDFSDGNFTNNPVWIGDTGKFEVNGSHQLHLNTTGADTAILCTNNSLINNTEWHFWVKFSFATSANNNARVYLVSDQQNIAGSLNGYFVQVGEANDSIALYKETGSTLLKLIHGTIAYTNNSTNALRIKVTRDNLGNWKLYSDPTGGTVFQLEGTGFDNSFSSTSWFGVFCKYTTSNATKFYYDDFYVGPIIVDTIPPQVTTVSIISSTKLDIQFSENVDLLSAENIANYSVDNNIGNPATATRDATNGSLVHLTFNSGFIEKINYTITISNIKDLSNNVMMPYNTTFLLYYPKPFDVLINELMVDPDPPVGLPNEEYAELYNRANYPINLKNWTFTTGSYIKVFPSIVIKPDSFIILCSQTAESLLSVYGITVGFSSFSLTNTGETVTLADSLGHIIHTVTYTDSWYGDDYKKNGGWSLEQIDPDNPCGEASNWRASDNMLGGTPGKINSVNAKNPDNTAPQLVRVSLINNNSIQLYFSEPMDSVFLQQNSNYIIDNGIGNPLSTHPAKPDYSSVILHLSSSIQTGIIYTITVIDSLKDCVGNTMPVNSSARFAIPELPSQNDIVINEILSNPKGNGVDYVELYNRSNKVIDLKDLVITSYDTIAATFTEVNDIAPGGYIMFPGDYTVITTNPAIVKSQYYTPNPNGFIQVPSMPEFNNDAGIAIIALKNLTTIIDKLVYSADMFNPLLTSNEGVSLERINFDRPSADKTNWHSASETVGFGTPAYKNSEYLNGEVTNDPVSVSPEIFSPDNDGNNDVLNINYKFDNAGYTANIVIYDASGRLIRNLVKNELLGTSGTFSWDGITNENEKARIGIYVIYFEVFDLKGNTKHYKKSAVLARKL